MYNYDSKELLCIALSYLNVNSPKKIIDAIEYFDDWDNLVISLHCNQEYITKLFDDNTYVRLCNAIKKGVLEKAIQALHDKGVFCVTYSSQEYPALLKNIADPPAVLYCKGNTALLNSECIAIVGTRKVNSYGKRVTHNFASDLAKYFTIVSGLAYGVDSIAHTTTLDVGGNTIAVLAGGLDSIYPISNTSIADMILENNGLLLSENPPNVKARQYSFPRRNRIVAGLSQGLLVTQAPRQSGTSSTVNYALEDGRDVFVVPGEIYDYGYFGCNDLIKSMQGSIVTEPSDILAYYGIGTLPTQQCIQEVLTEHEGRIVALLQEDKAHFDQIVQKCNLLPQQANILLANLQIRSIICKLPGNIYCLDGGKG